jgi:hypothetical protein
VRDTSGEEDDKGSNYAVVNDTQDKKHIDLFLESAEKGHGARGKKRELRNVW